MKTLLILAGGAALFGIGYAVYARYRNMVAIEQALNLSTDRMNALWETRKRDRARTLPEYAANIRHIEENFRTLRAAMGKEEHRV